MSATLASPGFKPTIGVKRVPHRARIEDDDPTRLGKHSDVVAVVAGAAEHERPSPLDAATRGEVGDARRYARALTHRSFCRVVERPEESRGTGVQSASGSG